jgi:hypothetical protein
MADVADLTAEQTALIEWPTIIDFGTEVYPGDWDSKELSSVWKLLAVVALPGCQFFENLRMTHLRFIGRFVYVSTLSLRDQVKGASCGKDK